MVGVSTDRSVACMQIKVLSVADVSYVEN